MKKFIALVLLGTLTIAWSTAKQKNTKSPNKDSIDLVLAVDSKKKVGTLNQKGEVILSSKKLPSPARIGDKSYHLSDLGTLGSAKDHTLYLTFKATATKGIETLLFATPISDLKNLYQSKEACRASQLCRGESCNDCQFDWADGCIIGCGCSEEANKDCNHTISSGKTQDVIGDCVAIALMLGTDL